MSADGFDLTIAPGFETPGRRLNKLDATTAPTGTDDADDGYEILSRWVDTVTDTAYICVDATVGLAQWVEVGGSGAVTLADLAALGIVGTLIVSEGITDPPEPVWSEDGTDFIYAEPGQ